MSIHNFRILAISEGISFLTLLLIAMPLKYLADIPEAVKVVGWIHGVLFMLYIPAVFLVRKTMHWNVVQVLIALAASIIPGGPFILDRKFFKKIAA